MLVCKEFLQSGLCDRILEIFILSVYLKFLEEDLAIVWPPFIFDNITFSPWRKYDTNLETILSFFKFPGNIQLVPSLDPTLASSPELPHLLYGFQISPAKLYETYLSGIEKDEYMKIVDTVKSEFKLVLDDYVPNEPYIVIHIRRTDKIVDDKSNDGFRIPESKLNNLEVETQNAIRHAFAIGHRNVYIASDDPLKKIEYQSFAQDVGFTILELENTTPFPPSYFDLWVMKSASLIIQSSYYTTFSLVPCVLWNRPLWVVLEDSKVFDYGFAKMSSIQYYKNVQLSSLGV